ncbi:carboxylesterase family protein [Myxococcota bacterium]|nr:carboxylesterase family protein [Myxococcota bacterium]
MIVSRAPSHALACAHLRPRRSSLVAASATALVLTACTSSTSELDAGVADVGSTPDAASVDAGSNDSGILDGSVISCDPPASSERGVVRTSFATLRGEARGSTFAWLGIRYAAPPVGELRFAPPAPPPCEEAVQDATRFGAICPQLDRQDQPTGDEDCLFLNVWAPQDPPPEPRPVLFFIHGGGNNQGASSVMAGTQAVYDGEDLASRGNVVVTINYRLGALGFAAHPALDALSPSGTSGNWALRDQIHALEWVRDNIARFGGDPERVMIFGESAGGVNTCALYTSPSARGLFSRALIQSGGCIAAPKSAGVDATARLAEGAGCATAGDLVGCLRSKTPFELLAALPPDVTGLTSADFGPIVDGVILPLRPQDAIVAGAHADVPLVIGTNEDETYQMLPPPAQIATPAAYEAAARAFLTTAGAPAALLDDIIAIYPPSDYGDDPHAALVALTSDWRWTCPARMTLTALATTATAPLRRYYFTHGLDPMRAPRASLAGAYHGLELFFVFGSVDGVAGYVPTPGDLALSARMQRYWTRFAASGDPNADEDPAWPAWDAESDPYLRLDEPTVAAEAPRGAQCEALYALLRG